MRSSARASVCPWWTSTMRSPAARAAPSGICGRKEARRRTAPSSRPSCWRRWHRARARCWRPPVGWSSTRSPRRPWTKLTWRSSYLRAAPETLAERVREDDQPRPLLTPDPLERLRDMHDRRDHRYRALAQLTEDVEGRSPQQLADAVIDAFARLRWSDPHRRKIGDDVTPTRSPRCGSGSGTGSGRVPASDRNWWLRRRSGSCGDGHQRPTAFSSCALFILERPLMFFSRASL